MADRTALDPPRVALQVLRDKKIGVAGKMGKRGPKPKSNKTKTLEGNPGNRPLEDASEKQDVTFGTLRMPHRLMKAEREIWKDTLAAFPSWYFTPADKNLLITYCRAVNRMEKSEKALKNKPSVQTRSNGSPCKNPL